MVGSLYCPASQIYFILLLQFQPAGHGITAVINHVGAYMYPALSQGKKWLPNGESYGHMWPGQHPMQELTSCRLMSSRTAKKKKSMHTYINLKHMISGWRTKTMLYQPILSLKMSASTNLTRTCIYHIDLIFFLLSLNVFQPKHAYN